MNIKRHTVKSFSPPGPHTPLFSTHSSQTEAVLSVACVSEFMCANTGQYDYLFFFCLFFMQKVRNDLKELFKEKPAMSSREVHIPAPVEAFPFHRIWL